MKVPTPEEFNTVYLLKYTKKHRRAIKKEARHQLKMIVKALKNHNTEPLIRCMYSPEARKIVRETLNAAGWNVKWCSDRGKNVRVTLTAIKDGCVPQV